MNHVAKYFLILLFLAPWAMADTVTAPCANYQCTVSLTTQPVGDVSVTLHALDADGGTEGRVSIGTACNTQLWGIYALPSNNDVWRDIGPYQTAGTCWGVGQNVITFNWTAPEPSKHDVDRITLTYTPAAPATGWNVLAGQLEAFGWVPPWLSVDDNVWAIPREDLDPARTMICAVDKTTGARFATWLDTTLETLPAGPAPVATQCDLAWCNATGDNRDEAIDAACP